MEEKRQLIKKWVNDHFSGKYKVLFTDDDEIIIDGNIFLTDYTLEELEYKFAEVCGDFWIAGEKFPGEGQVGYRSIKTLKNCPEKVKGSFSCHGNQNLKSLDGGPKIVGNDYICTACGLETLNGLATEIGGYLTAFNNHNLKDISAIEHSEIGNYIDLEFADESIFKSSLYKKLYEDNRVLNVKYREF